LDTAFAHIAGGGVRRPARLQALEKIKMVTKLSTEENILHKCKSREAASIIGMLLGGLVGFLKLEDFRTAVKWWAETDKAWELLALLRPTHHHNLHTLEPTKIPERDVD